MPRFQRPELDAPAPITLRIPQYINGVRYVDDMVLDTSRGSVLEILQHGDETALPRPRFAVDWRHHVREVKERGRNQCWNGIAWQISHPTAATPCTACSGGKGTFIACTRGPNGEFCGHCRFQRRGFCVPYTDGGDNGKICPTKRDDQY